MCDLTKYLVTISIPNKVAITMARAIFQNFILVYGPMKYLLTDRRSEYVNNILNELCVLLKIKHNTSTAYQHRTLGTVDRSHRNKSYFDESS